MTHQSEEVIIKDSGVMRQVGNDNYIDVMLIEGQIFFNIPIVFNSP